MVRSEQPCPVANCRPGPSRTPLWPGRPPLVELCESCPNRRVVRRQLRRSLLLAHRIGQIVCRAVSTGAGHSQPRAEIASGNAAAIERARAFGPVKGRQGFGCLPHRNIKKAQAPTLERSGICDRFLDALQSLRESFLGVVEKREREPGGVARAGADGAEKFLFGLSFPAIGGKELRFQQVEIRVFGKQEFCLSNRGERLRVTRQKKIDGGGVH